MQNSVMKVGTFYSREKQICLSMNSIREYVMLKDVHIVCYLHKLYRTKSVIKYKAL